MMTDLMEAENLMAAATVLLEMYPHETPGL
jgi:hypothetical protein